MKELSIEEKAKAYDEAKSIMEEYLKSGNAGVIAENTIKKAFPELEESEEEKTKRMLDVISYKMSQHQPDIFTEEENEWFYYWLKDKLKINYV